MIYLDNAATSWPKPREVTRKITDCLETFCANPGRSGHSMALQSEQEVFNCRVKICDLFGISNPSNVIFTYNATHALNIVIKGILEEGSHAVITSLEHNSVMRPLAACGAMYDVACADKYGYTDVDNVARLIKPNTSLIICTLSSNVCGSVQPFQKIAAVAKRHNIPFLLDASQGAGSIDIDMEAMGIDYLAAPGHKGLLGPTGTGVLCIAGKGDIRTIMEGGTGSDSKLVTQPFILPDRFECGTLNVAGIAGLGASLDYISKCTTSAILEHELCLADRLAENLASLSNVRLIGYDKSRPRTAVVSVVIDGVDSLGAALKLNIDYQVAVRAGFHCAYTAHTALGTHQSGTIRFSPGIFNTRAEIDKVSFAVKQIALQKGK